MKETFINTMKSHNNGLGQHIFLKKLLKERFYAFRQNNECRIFPYEDMENLTIAITITNFGIG